jgi:uncharacterized protein (DUF433 family)
LGKNPKAKKPMNQKDSGPSPGVESPPSERVAQAPNPRTPSGETAAVVREAFGGNDSVATGGARVVHRDGVAYVDGCEVPIWRLEMARRAGSGRPALIAAFPGLTSADLDMVFAYARAHRAELNQLIRSQAAAAEPARDEGPDDAATFETDLGTLLDTNAEVFRRLAQQST